MSIKIGLLYENLCALTTGLAGLVGFSGIKKVHSHLTELISKWYLVMVVKCLAVN